MTRRAVLAAAYNVDGLDVHDDVEAALEAARSARSTN
jgi:hypothetical protein